MVMVGHTAAGGGWSEKGIELIGRENMVLLDD